MFEVIEIIGDEGSELLHLQILLEVEIRLDERDDMSAVLFVKVLDEIIQLAEFSHDDGNIFLCGMIIGFNDDELIPITCFLTAFDVYFDVFEELYPLG